MVFKTRNNSDEIRSKGNISVLGSRISLYPQNISAFYFWPQKHWTGDKSNGQCIPEDSSINFALPSQQTLSNNHRLLNVYCEIFGTGSYGEGRTSLRVRLRHMNECRIFHNIHSITFLLYTIYIYLLVSSGVVGWSESAG